LPDAPVAVGDGQLGLKLGDLVAQSSVLGQQQLVVLNGLTLPKGAHRARFRHAPISRECTTELRTSGCHCKLL
jgi:hypothetical protein